MEPIKINYYNIRAINGGEVRGIAIPKIHTFLDQPFHAIPPYLPVTETLYIGTPIIDMPGCVQVYKDSKKNKKIGEDDPKGVETYCDANTPSFVSIEYEPEQMTVTYNQEPPPVAPPPDPPGTPEVPETGGVTEEEVPCPGPNAPRIGTLGPNEKEKVSGYELQTDPANPAKTICVILYEDIGPIEQYLPSAQVASTTAAIATVAGASALLAKPLADLILKVFKPAIKKLLTKVTGKAPVKPSRSEIRANEYREKKGLPPIKHKSKK